jgi:hypothetical protein
VKIGGPGGIPRFAPIQPLHSGVRRDAGIQLTSPLMRFSLLVVLILLPPAARADVVDAVRGRLQGLKVPTVLDADASFRQLPTADKPQAATRQPVAVHVHEDAHGLQIGWAAGLVRDFLVEQRREVNDAEPASVIGNGLDEIRAREAILCLHPSEEIERQLLLGRLTDDQKVVDQGKPARLLTFAITPPLTEQNRKIIKELVVTLKLWLADDLTPIAAELNSHVRGRVFLVITFSSDDIQRFRFATVDGRLVVTAHEKEGSSAGGGQSHSYHSETRLVFAGS